MRAGALLALLLLLTVPQTVSAADLYPTPEFGSHSVPQPQTPAGRVLWQDWLDLGFLTAALAAQPGLRTLRTDVNGRIVVESDGRTLTVRSER